MTIHLHDWTPAPNACVKGLTSGLGRPTTLCYAQQPAKSHLAACVLVTGSVLGGDGDA
jgi:hypothetical protein